MDKISVIVPVYKVENYIGRCIESIQKQTLADWELILIDDCSPDNSFSIISKYAETDSRIIVKKHDVNHIFYILIFPNNALRQMRRRSVFYLIGAMVAIFVKV